MVLLGAVVRSQPGRWARCLGLGALLLGEQHGVDVGEHPARRDGDAREQLGELLVVADGELDVARDHARLLVVARGVPGELKDLGGEVLQDRGEVHRGAGADAGGEFANLEVPRDSANRELKTRFGGSRDGFLTGFTFTTSRHCCFKRRACFVVVYAFTSVSLVGNERDFMTHLVPNFVLFSLFLVFRVSFLKKVHLSNPHLDANPVFFVLSNQYRVKRYQKLSSNTKQQF